MIIKVWDVASTAKVHLDKSRSFHKSVPPHAVPALLSSVSNNIVQKHMHIFVILTALQVFVDDFLTRLEQTNFNIFEPQLQERHPWLFWKLLYNNYKHKY